MTNLIPSTQDFNTLKEIGRMAISSGLIPTTIKTPEQAMIILLKGRELGIPPMQAFSSIAVVSGKPTMSAELMLSLIYKNVPGAIVNYLRSDDKACEIEAKRPGGKPAKFSFSMADAERAGLAGKGPWKQYPAALLRARTISAMARAVFPDALSGVVYTPEELGAQVDDEGDIVSAPIIETPPAPVVQKLQPSSQLEAKIFFGSEDKGYKGLTVGQAIERDGLPRVQQYLHYWDERFKKDGKGVPESFANFRNAVFHYTQQLLIAEQDRARAEAVADELSDEDWDRVERMTDSMLMRNSGMNELNYDQE